MNFRRSLCMLGWALAGFFFARWLIACGGAEFTSIDARAVAGDAGEDLADGPVSIRIPTSDGAAALGPEVAAGDAAEPLVDAAHDDHPVMTTDAGAARESSTPLEDAAIDAFRACAPQRCPVCAITFGYACCVDDVTCGCANPSNGGQCR